MKKLKHLASVLGFFGGVAGIVFFTGITVNGYMTYWGYLITMAILVIVTLICVAYINAHTKNGEWVD